MVHAERVVRGWGRGWAGGSLAIVDDVCMLTVPGQVHYPIDCELICGLGMEVLAEIQPSNYEFGPPRARIRGET